MRVVNHSVYGRFYNVLKTPGRLAKKGFKIDRESKRINRDSGHAAIVACESHDARERVSHGDKQFFFACRPSVYIVRERRCIESVGKILITFEKTVFRSPPAKGRVFYKRGKKPTERKRQKFLPPPPLSS